VVGSVGFGTNFATNESPIDSTVKDLGIEKRPSNSRTPKVKMRTANITSDDRESPLNQECNQEDRLYQAAMTALRASGYGLLTKLLCETAAGVVTISGSVPSYFLKQLAQEIILRLAHVREVRNQVQVQQMDFVPPLGMDGSPGKDIG
jgi:osmotically-inducible protein OsmY